MIPYEIALLAWIAVSFIFMMDHDNARGFSMAFVGGMLFLPAGAVIDLPSFPDLDKENVTSLGVLLGTVVFHPQLFDRYKFSIADLVLLGLMLVTFLTSIINGFGAYDGLSQTAAIVSTTVLPLFLARIHIGTLKSLRTFLLALLAGACVLVPMAAWEFRMSPQFHTWTYGYFQHVFAQHYRGGFWRPILYFSHALALGRFFALAAFLALVPLRRDLVRYLGGAGHFVFLIPLFGLLLSQSYGPYLFFVLLCAGYFIIRRRPRLILVMPVVAFVWLAFNMAGGAVGYGITDRIHAINPDRASSLEYRLDALQEYRTVIWNRPLFGHGGWGHGRIEGRATDSQALISLIYRGYVGTFVYFLWWFSALAVAYSVALRTRGTIFGQRAAAIAVLLALAISVTTIDAALDLHLILLAGALFPIHRWLLTGPEVETLPKRVPLPGHLTA